MRPRRHGRELPGRRRRGRVGHLSRALVVGAGVVGLTCAIRLREAGVEASVIAREPPAETTSAVAAALWYPYRAYPRERVGAWSARGFEVLSSLAGVPETGVRMRAGLELVPAEAEDPWWRDAVPDFSRTERGYRFTAPVADMSVHLPWLVERLRALGGTVERGSVERLEGAPLVVNCAGLGARALAVDDTMVAVRGQIVVVERAAGVDEFLLDQTDAARPLYVVPRERDVVLGGTAQEGDESADVDPATAEVIVDRCVRAVPELRGARVLRHAVGLRPGRPAVRLEAETVAGGRVIHCYGHGGAGVTLAWGCAEEVARLV